MSKRSKEQRAKKQTLVQTPGKRRDAVIRNTSKGKAQVYERPPISDERLVMGIRVLGFSVAVLVLATAYYWASTLNGDYPIWAVAGIILLGVIGGFGLFVAARASEIARRARR